MENRFVDDTAERIEVLEAWAQGGRIPRRHEMQSTMDETTSPEEWESLFASLSMAPRNRHEARDMTRSHFSRVGRVMLGFGAWSRKALSI